MGVSIFDTAENYREWAEFQMNKKIIDVTVFDGKLVVTWKNI